MDLIPRMTRRAAMGTLALLPAAMPLSAAIAPPTTLAGLAAAVQATGLSAAQKSLLLQVLDGVRIRVLGNQLSQAVALLGSFLSYVGKFGIWLSLAESADLTGQANALIALYTGIGNGLLAYWKFDEGTGVTAADSSGHNVTGTLMNGAGWSTAGKSGKALSLNGAPQFVNLGNPAFPTGLAARSMCGWGKPNNIGAGFRWIFAYGAPGISNAMFIGMNGDTLFGGGYGDDLIVPGIWDTNWHHVALTYNGATAVMYFDGLQVASGPKVWPLVPFVAYLGEQVNSAGEIWNGLIDEVRMYNRVLTPAEVAVLAGLP